MIFRTLIVFTIAMLAAVSAFPDSTLAWSTYFGGSHGTVNWDTAVDVNGDVIVTGMTRGGLPVTVGAYDTTYNGDRDAFAAKFDGDTGQLIWATYLGGTAFDEGQGILPLANGDIVISGNTDSSFDVPDGPYDQIHSLHDMFLIRLSGDGSTMVAGMYLGGNNSEYCWERNRMALDPSGNICVTGISYSTDFATAGAYDATAPANGDAFVAKVSPTLDDIVFVTMLGGSTSENGKGVACDTNGNVYVTGMTTSSDFPSTAGAYDETFNGNWDAFLAKISSDGSSLLFSTFIGGTGKDYGLDIVLDGSGRPVISGNTHSPEFPVTVGAYDTTFGNPSDGADDAIVAKFSTDGTQLVAATFVGGSGGEISLGLARGGDGSIWISGETTSRDLPLTADAFQKKLRGTKSGSYAVALSDDLSQLVYGSYLSSRGKDLDGHIAADAAGNAYVGGVTRSANFPTTPGAFQTAKPGNIASFLSKISPAP